jgi:hypothetical protein
MGAMGATFTIAPLLRCDERHMGATFTFTHLFIMGAVLRRDPEFKTCARLNELIDLWANPLPTLES